MCQASGHQPRHDSPPGMSNLASNLGQIGPERDKSRTFEIRFSTFWFAQPKCTETSFKKSQICLIWGQSDPMWMPNWISLTVTNWDTKPTVEHSGAVLSGLSLGSTTVVRYLRDIIVFYSWPLSYNMSSHQSITIIPDTSMNQFLFLIQYVRGKNWLLLCLAMFGKRVLPMWYNNISGWKF